MSVPVMLDCIRRAMWHLLLLSLVNHLSHGLDVIHTCARDTYHRHPRILREDGDAASRPEQVAQLASAGPDQIRSDQDMATWHFAGPL
jgi:hypothetical protein